MFQPLRAIFIHTRLQTEEESLLHKSENKSRVDQKVFIVCITSALCLVCINYLNSVSKFSSFLEAIGMKGTANSMMSLYEHSGNRNLFHLEYWALMLFFFYFLVPIAVTRFILKEKAAEFGLSVKGALKDNRIYLSLIAIMLPIVFAISFTGSFQAKYPFYDPARGEALYPDFFTWECFYFLQFVGLEFFFRGFMLHGIKKQFGYYSVLVMMLPYCMIHFGKPMAETIGAIAAGIVLGTLSLKSRSIWLGVAIHYSVAITMDICALWQKGFFNH